MNHLLPLKKNSKIGIVASSSPFNKDEFDKAIKFLKAQNFNPVYTNVVFKKDGFVAGTPQERFKDLIKHINDDKTGAIFFVRGGYGVAQILPFLEKKNLKLNNKIFLGYSDVTALYCHLYKKYKTPLFYGPNLISRHFSNKVLNYLTYPKDLKIKVEVLKAGKTINAPIFGGCLSVLTSMVGTSYMPSLKNHILFIEDTNETPYKIDRMLNQLLLSGTIKGIKAIAVGAMEKCEAPPYTWREPVLRIAKILNVPVIAGIRAGHAEFDLVIPFGVKAKLDLIKKELIIPWKS